LTALVVQCLPVALSGGESTSIATMTSHRVSLSGWFHVIWNGEPRFMLADDRGLATRLEIDDAVLSAVGGARALNQKRVNVVGERVSETPAVIRVLSIDVEIGPK
jgi:hypothetical protein